MYWALYPFDYEGTPLRGEWRVNEEQKKEIDNGVTFSDPHFTIEPIGDKHKELYKSWIDSPLKMDFVSFPLNDGFVVDDHGQDIAHHILSGFRLLNDDYIKYLYRFDEGTFSFPNFNIVQYPKYIFYYNENDKFIDIIKNILSLDQNNKIMTAINFYNFSYNTTNHPVEQLRKLGNLMTAAEALFVPPDSRNSKQVPIRNGIADLLGTDSDSRTLLDQEFQAAYNIRNSFVHSGNVLEVIKRYGKERIGVFVREIQSNIRKAILKSLI